ncbi:hypothetical protein ABHI18_000645 [Aspergillus niger]
MREGLAVEPWATVTQSPRWHIILVEASNEVPASEPAADALQIEQLKFQQRIHGSPLNTRPKIRGTSVAKQADKSGQAIVDINN